MALWNIKDLALPPIATYKANTKDIDIVYLRQVCRDSRQFFEDKKIMHAEYLILSRIVYRMKQKFRSAKDFKAVVKMYKTLDNYFKINIAEYINTFMELIPYNYEDDSTYLPTKNLVDYILVRHQGIVKLLVRIVETSKLAAHLLEERIHIGHSWQGAFILFAIASRVYVLSKFIIQKACDFYQKLLPFSSKLKNLGTDWLKSDYKLPKDLRQWLNVDWLDIDDEVKILEEPEIPRITDFFDLVDDEDVQFCDEYIVLDDSLLNRKGNKNNTMLEYSIKSLRGFDLEDEGEIIEIDSMRQNTSSNCESFGKLLEKDLQLLVNDMTVIPAKGTVCSSNDVLDESTKHIEDNDDLTLSFGDISAIPNPNDTTLTRENVDKLHSTAIHPDELTVQNINDNASFIPHSESQCSLNKKSDTNIPSNSRTVDNSVEIIEKDVTVISIHDTTQDKASYNPEVDVCSSISCKNKKNVENVLPSISNNTTRSSQTLKKKKQRKILDTPKYNETIFPSTSKTGIKTDCNSKPQKLSNSTKSVTKIHKASDVSDFDVTLPTGFVTSDVSDFNVTLPAGFVVLSSDSEDLDSTIVESCVSMQKGPEKSRFQSHYISDDSDDADLQDSWFFDYNRSEIAITKYNHMNRNFIGEPRFPSGHTPGKNKRHKKKRSVSNSDFTANPPKRARLERDQKPDITNRNLIEHIEPNVKGKNRKGRGKGKSKRYYNMKIAE
ncbi:unnamed protein product [Acanthoscelides obtectus]|uniref:Nucleolus and neural progenitor protein-like N-terminal domain-containing protein n=1 Tax=Acanthoscelides obtectus TaxID=200917 RepID=A0A9P0K195_ACAOB|nr:unnamed protein product [Acanthoscelides obtectus]CAK1646989.1 hypothetical protein AOBTE_LOCUS14990 [Acanthoscelides obtectus]